MEREADGKVVLVGGLGLIQDKAGGKNKSKGLEMSCCKFGATGVRRTTVLKPEWTGFISFHVLNIVHNIFKLQRERE